MDKYIKRFEPLWDEWYMVDSLGEGSFGQVWEMEYRGQQKKRNVAVKEVVIPRNGDLRPAKAAGLDEAGAKYYFGEVLKTTLSEVDLMKELSDCENIVQYEDYEIRELTQEDEFGWVVYIRMEKLQTLSDKWQEEKMDSKEVARLGIHIARALEKCEELGIVHRDIKPDNLYYNVETKTYKLGDFGIAHHLNRPTAGKGRAGTLTHMAPEVYAGAAFDLSSDLYALGMILYCQLNRKRIPGLPVYPIPFSPDERNRALIERLRGGSIEEPCEGGVLAPIVKKAIDPLLENRYPSAKNFREALEKAI